MNFLEEIAEDIKIYSFCKPISLLFLIVILSISLLPNKSYSQIINTAPDAHIGSIGPLVLCESEKGYITFNSTTGLPPYTYSFSINGVIDSITTYTTPYTYTISFY